MTDKASAKTGGVHRRRTSSEPVRGGVARIDVTPAPGSRLLGYPFVERRSCGGTEKLEARILTLRAGSKLITLCSADLLAIGEDVYAAVLARLTLTLPGLDHRPILAATHTHSAAGDADADAYPTELAGLVAEGVGQALRSERLVSFDAGWGWLHGHHFNRRRMEDAVDPAIGVMRVDSHDGEPLATIYVHGCHPVVLGPANVIPSADWPGSASRWLERHMGEGAVALFLQGGGGDANPVIPALERAIHNGRRIAAYADGAEYPKGPGEALSLATLYGTRKDAERLGEQVAEVVWSVRAALRPRSISASGVRHVRFSLPAASSSLVYRTQLLDAVGWPPEVPEWPRSDPSASLSFDLLAFPRISTALLAQPGEVLSESSRLLRATMRRCGYEIGLVSGCTNGWRLYLPPTNTWPDGGYEVLCARAIGVPRDLQDQVCEAVTQILG